MRMTVILSLPKSSRGSQLSGGPTIAPSAFAGNGKSRTVENRLHTMESAWTHSRKKQGCIRDRKDRVSPPDRPEPGIEPALFCRERLDFRHPQLTSRRRGPGYGRRKVSALGVGPDTCMAERTRPIDPEMA